MVTTGIWLNEEAVTAGVLDIAVGIPLLTEREAAAWLRGLLATEDMNKSVKVYFFFFLFFVCQSSILAVLHNLNQK